MKCELNKFILCDMCAFEHEYSQVCLYIVHFLESLTGGGIYGIVLLWATLAHEYTSETASNPEGVVCTTLSKSSWLSRGNQTPLLTPLGSCWIAASDGLW